MVNVAQVNLYFDELRDQQGVMNRNRIMRVGPRIDHEPLVLFIGELLNACDDISFCIGLKIVDFDLWIAAFELFEDLFEGFGPIKKFFATPQHIQIGAIDDQDFHCFFFELCQNKTVGEGLVENGNLTLCKLTNSLAAT